ncbi:MAG: hypothetical protein HQ503_04760 [Rhodospirillales bacterium]|nr:hypothetical protein [Rhodospirillales bacterium]
MDDLAIARALHVISVVLWIGGVAFVTTTLLPSLRRSEGASAPALFAAIESPFARQARYTTLLAGGSGFYMLYRLDAWERFTDASYWWLHGMVFIWALFTLMLFVLEPWVLHKQFQKQAAADPALALARIQAMHIVLLTLSLIVIFGAVWGSHS